MSNVNVEQYIWKLKKDPITRKYETVKMVECSLDKLGEFKNHCNSMLYSKDKNNPGGFTLLETINDQINSCKTELFFRKYNINKFTFLDSIRAFRESNKDVLNELLETGKIKYIPLSICTDNLDEEFKNIPLDIIVQGCLYNLGAFTNDRLSLNFILNRLGLYLTKTEYKQFLEENPGAKIKDILQIIKEQLLLNPDVKIRIHEKGLSYSEFRAILKANNMKYEDMSTEQLNTLIYKVLPQLIILIESQIETWETLLEQIEEVIDYKMS